MPYYRCAACGLTSYSASAYSTASSCPNCSASLQDATVLHLTPGTAGATTRVLAARPESVAQARREVVGLPLPLDTRERLALIVSELVSNSVIHAGDAPGGRVRMEMTMAARRARIEVHDGGPGFDPPPSVRPDPLSVGGQGLVIVAALADSWGVVRAADGCTVWAEVRVEEPETAVRSPEFATARLAEAQ